MDRARAAQPGAAAELRARQFKRVAPHPKQWHLWNDVHNLGLAIQRERHGRHGHPPEDSHWNNETGQVTHFGLEMSTEYWAKHDALLRGALRIMMRTAVNLTSEGPR